MRRPPPKRGPVGTAGTGSPERAAAATRRRWRRREDEQAAAPCSSDSTRRAARRWALTTRAVFAARRGEIDALNVFPVPDGDTGTNLYLTLDAALDAVRAEHAAAGHPTTPTSRATPTPGPRRRCSAPAATPGSSSASSCAGLREASPASERRGRGRPALARALTRAERPARASVARPVEGTILSVARGRRGAASGVADARRRPVRRRRRRRSALRARPWRHDRASCPALARAGVVDAGAAGYVLVLESLVRSGVRRGRSRRRRPASGPGAARPRPAVDPSSRRRPTDADGPAYEVMYLLGRAAERGGDAARGARRARRLAARRRRRRTSGTSTSTSTTWVRPSRRVSPPGRPHRIRVTALRRAAGSAPPRPRRRRAVVACAAGRAWPRLARSPAPGRRARRAGGRPGRAARRGPRGGAAGSSCCPTTATPGRRPRPPPGPPPARACDVRVVPTRGGPGPRCARRPRPRPRPDDDLVAMTSAAPPPVTARSTVAEPRGADRAPGRATRATCSGMVDGDVVVIGSDLAEVGGRGARPAARRGGELVTLVGGRGRAARAGRRDRAPRSRTRRPASTSSVTTAGSPPTRCWSVSSDVADRRARQLDQAASAARRADDARPSRCDLQTVDDLLGTTRAATSTAASSTDLPHVARGRRHRAGEV